MKNFIKNNKGWLLAAIAGLGLYAYSRNQNALPAVAETIETEPLENEIITYQEFPDQRTQNSFDVVRNAINNGLNIVYFRKTRSAVDLLEENQATWTDRTVQQSAAAFATWSTKKDQDIFPA